MVHPNLLDLFCGCGGISEGFRLAGFKIIGGIDFDPDSIETFRNNFHNAKAICTDILEFNDQKIFNEFGACKVDIIVGGPPCQGFSSANRWQKENTDPRNKLFFEYLRFVEILKPKIVLIENVRGILTRNEGYAKKRIMDLLEKLNYSVSSEVLNASHYGVPQSRLRAFFVAIRKDFLDQSFDFHKVEKQNKVTVKEAIGALYVFNDPSKGPYFLDKEPGSEYERYLRSRSNEVQNHEIRFPAELTQKRISHVPQGGNWENIPNELFLNKRNNRHSSAFKRLKEDDCSVTIDTGNAHSNYFHPLYNRIPTVREAARLQSFKDEFIIAGSRTSQYRQIGNAVPPLLAKSIAVEILKLFVKK